METSLVCPFLSLIIKNIWRLNGVLSGISLRASFTFQILLLILRSTEIPHLIFLAEIVAIFQIVATRNILALGFFMVFHHFDQ